MKQIIFDMDGTIANLYGYDNWLEHLINKSEKPYKECEPLENMKDLKETLNQLKLKDYRIVIVSWLAKNSTKEYDKKVRQAKKEWLEKYQFPYDTIHLVKYGTNKSKFKDNDINYLIDDDIKVRKEFERFENCISINPIYMNETFERLLNEYE